MMADDNSLKSPISKDKEVAANAARQAFRRLRVSVTRCSDRMGIAAGQDAPIGYDDALHILVATGLATSPRQKREHLADALVSIAAEIMAAIRSGTEFGDAEAAAAVRKTLAAFQTALDVAQAHGCPARTPGYLSYVEEVSAWEAGVTAFTPYFATERGRRKKGDALAYGLLLSFFEEASGEEPRPSGRCLTMVQKFMEAAGPEFDAAELNAAKPPVGQKTAGRRWLPISAENFSKRFPYFVAAMDRDWMRRLIEQAKKPSEK
jgi:hypothetical protein